MKTILLIEDNDDNRMVIEDLFEFDIQGARLVTATSAEEGLSLLEELDPMLVLMDLGLPGMSGIEAIRRIRAAPAICHLPIWALTAHAMKDVRAEAMEAGCEDYVTKPVDTTDLARRLTDFLATEVKREAA